MKKRNEWVTRKTKREKRKKLDRGIIDFIRVVKHFFKDIPKWIGEMDDPRHQSYTTYTQADLFWTGVLKNACSVWSMAQMNSAFNEDACAHTLSVLSGHEGLSEVPHGDTLNRYLERLPPECLSALRRKMVRCLLRGKNFHKSRLLGKYWRVILDGTGLFYFRERHCPGCLKETRKGADGKKAVRYYHKVLEAKIVLAEGFVVSLGTEFIENEKEDVPKQDCEMNAAKRLLPRLKKEYPRLPACLQADALYETEPMMGLCMELGWRYLFTHKDTRQRGAGEDYALLTEGDKETVEGIGKEQGTGAFYNGVGELAGKRMPMNLFEYTYKDKGGKETRFQWNTDIGVTKRNLETLIHAGRGRWQIENEGFNHQKNILYGIEHLNSRKANAMKCHYLLTQVADILMQIYLHWNPMVKRMGQGIKDTSSRLLESFRRHTVTDEDVCYVNRRTSLYLE